MPIIIFFIIGIFFNGLNALAFDKEDFAEKFYENIQNQVEKDEKNKVVDRINHTTGLSTKLVENLTKNKLTVDNQTELTDWCKRTGTYWNNSHCTEELKRALFFEMELAETETELQTQLTADETWADGTLRNSPFDLVVDLNILDVILFGSEADIPLSRWEKSDEDSEDGEDEDSEDKDNEDGENEDSENGEDENSGNEDSEDNNPVDDELTDDFIPAKQPFIGVIEHLNDEEYGNLKCRDPESIVVIDYEKWKSENDDSNKQNGNNNADNNGNNNADDNNNNNGANGNIGNGANSDQGTGFEILPLPDKEKCANDLYDGNFCKPVTEEKESCDATKGVCKKCFGSKDGKSKDSWIDFCITWEFKVREHSLFASRRVEDSINAFIKDSLIVYEDLLGMSPLTPIRRSNREAEQPNWWSIFKTPGKWLYIEGKIPDQWSNEPKQISFTQATLYKNLQNYQKKTSQLFNCDQNYFDKRVANMVEQPQVSTNCQNISVLKKQLEWEKIKRESKNEETEVYNDNIKQNLAELNSVFYNRFTNQINMKWASPFKEIIDARELNCRDWENK